MSDKKDIKQIVQNVLDIENKAVDISKQIWQYAELSYDEYKSSNLLIDELSKEGFVIEKNLAGIKTAFSATYSVGTGKPVIALLGEFDALDNLCQSASCPVKDTNDVSKPGHGCGHNLLGAGSYAAAVAVKRYMQTNNLDGTIIYYGCPAEEGNGSKNFMAKAGVFNNVDCAYTWHPADVNEVSMKPYVAIIGADFTFKGTSSHAGGSPDLGRSALDAAELMNVGCNYLREHTPDKTRISYSYLNAGGLAPNVVQDYSKIKYEIRYSDIAELRNIFERVVNVARGAALMTGTKMSYEEVMSFADYQPNLCLAKVAYNAMEEIGAPEWTKDDYKLAEEFQKSFGENYETVIQAAIDEVYKNEKIENECYKYLHSQIAKFKPEDNDIECGCTDVGDVSKVVPTISISVATTCIGRVGHTWQMTSMSNSSLGYKGMIKAAQILALSCVETFKDNEIIVKAKEELNKR